MNRTVIARLPNGDEVMVRSYASGEVEVDVRGEGRNVWTPIELVSGGSYTVEDEEVAA